MIRRLTSEHLAAVAELEALCFSEPWSEQALQLLTRGGAVGFVAIEKEQLVAYGGMMYVLDEGQITNIATHPHFRGKGNAAAVLAALEDFAKEQQLTQITLEVRESNAAAISLYKKSGFAAVGERRSFYRKPTENAVIMKKTLNGDA